ncbi:hypothetical protein SDJN02_01206, partial [Cucurbita argyrosperma subsp. argyrosperma]
MDSASLASLAPSLAPSHTPQNLHRVFVYGSLLSDEVVHILLKRTPQSSAAVLNDLFEWKRDHLDAYLEMVNEFIEEFEHQPPKEPCAAVDEAGQRCEQPLHSPAQEEEEPSKLNGE